MVSDGDLYGDLYGGLSARVHCLGDVYKLQYVGMVCSRLPTSVYNALARSLLCPTHSPLYPYNQATSYYKHSNYLQYNKMTEIVFPVNDAMNLNGRNRRPCLQCQRAQVRVRVFLPVLVVIIHILMIPSHSVIYSTLTLRGCAGGVLQEAKYVFFSTMVTPRPIKEPMWVPWTQQHTCVALKYSVDVK